MLHHFLQCLLFFFFHHFLKCLKRKRAHAVVVRACLSWWQTIRADHFVYVFVFSDCCAHLTTMVFNCLFNCLFKQNWGMLFMRPSLVVRELYEMPFMFLFNTTEFQNVICWHIIKLYLHVAFCTFSLDAYFPFTQGHGRTDHRVPADACGSGGARSHGLVWAESSSGRVESHLEEKR